MKVGQVEKMSVMNLALPKMPEMAPLPPPALDLGLVDTLVEACGGVAAGEKYTRENCLSIIPEVFRVVSQHAAASASDKKTVTLQVVKRLLAPVVGTYTESELSVFDGIAAVSVDMLVSALASVAASVAASPAAAAAVSPGAVAVAAEKAAEDYIDAVFAQITAGVFNAYDWKALISKAMRAVVSIRDLKGSEKKRLVVQVVRRVLDENKVDEEIKMAYDIGAPIVIDVLYSVSTGEIPIVRGLQESCRRCLPCLFAAR